MRTNRLVHAANFVRANFNLPKLRKASANVKVAYDGARKRALHGVVPHIVVSILGVPGTAAAYVEQGTGMGLFIGGLTAFLASTAAVLYRYDLTHDTLTAALGDPQARSAMTTPARAWTKAEQAAAGK